MKKTQKQVEDELKVVLLKIIDVDSEELKPDAHFYQDLGVDSIKAIEITVAIEKHFKVSFKEEEIVKLTTLAKASEAIYKSLAKEN